MPNSPAPPGSAHWFEAVADHLGEAYLRYSFTYGSEQEVGFLVDVLDLEPGMRVLDVGCGPGRHARRLAERGIEVVGIDVAERFVELARIGAPPGATFVRADAREMAFEEEFDAAYSLCQGGFGLPGDASAPLTGPEPDLAVLSGIARALRRGAPTLVSAFSAYFQVRFLEHSDSFDPARGINHERTELRDPAGAVKETDLWTACYTPRELRLLASAAGLVPEAVWGGTPGGYGRYEPTLDQHEFLLYARRPPIGQR